MRSMPEQFEAEVHPRLAAWLGRIVDGCILSIIFFVPLLVSPWTLDALELPKQTFLIGMVLIAFVAWLGQAMCLKKLTVSFSWIHLVVLIFLVSCGLGSWFSVDRYASLVGSSAQIHWSLSSLLSYGMLYVLMVNTHRQPMKLLRCVLAFLLSSIVLGIVALLHFFGIFPLALLGGFAAHSWFTTIGSVNAFGLFMTIPLLLAASLTIYGCRNGVCEIFFSSRTHEYVITFIVWMALLVSVVVTTLIDFWMIWFVILCGTIALVAIPLLRRERIKHPIQILIPAVLVGISLWLLIFHTPFHMGLPSEVTPSWNASFDIARRVLQERPIFGSGPGTWLFEYSQFRSVAVNLSPYWTMRFEQAGSTFLTLLPTFGLIGAALWLILFASVFSQSVWHLLKEKRDDIWQLYLTLWVGWSAVVLISFVSSDVFALSLLGWFLLAGVSCLMSAREIVWETRRSVTHSAILSLIFLAALVASASTFWLVSQRFMAEVVLHGAVGDLRSEKPPQDSIEALQQAARLNAWSDVAPRMLSQAYYAQAKKHLQTTSTEDRMNRVNAAMSSSVDFAKRATEISPANVENWQSFATILSGVATFTQGADEQTIKMFEEALRREPNNPVFYTEIGKMYILRADTSRQLIQSPDEVLRKQATERVMQSLEAAAQALNQAIQAKSDFAPAHYSLALVYERQGRIKDAITKLEQVLRLDSKNVGIGFQLAILYYRDHRRDKSLDLFEQIVAFQPDYANARWYLSSLYEELGRYDDAIAQLRTIQSQNPDTQSVADRLAQLIAKRDANTQPKTQILPEPIKEIIPGPEVQLHEEKQ